MSVLKRAIWVLACLLLFTLLSVHADELHSAAVSGDMARIRMLLKAWANFNTKNKDGWTALHVAALAGQVVAIDVLLRAGANVNAKSNAGEAPLDAARVGMDYTEKSIKPFLAVMELLKAHGGR